MNVPPPKKLDQKSNDWRSVFLCPNILLILRRKLLWSISMGKADGTTLLKSTKLSALISVKSSSQIHMSVIYYKNKPDFCKRKDKCKLIHDGYARV